jgi:hypothetical protein
MNKTKRSMPAKLRKKMNKELRSATNQPDSVLKSDRITPQDLLSRLPLKVRKKEEALVKSAAKNIAIKKAKAKAPHSKRTNTGGGVKSSPQIIHIEGKQWIKTLGKQTQAKRKVMTRQMAKKGSK